MLVTPRPGVNRENLLKTLQSVYTDAYNLRGGGGAARNAYERLLAYIEWTSAAVRMLGSQVSKGDLDRLVLTERYQLLAGLAGTITSPERPVQRVVNGLVSLELDERVVDFEAVIKALQGQIARWSAYGHYVVPDTSFYIHHRDKLEDVDFGPLINVWQSEVTVLVPIVIVDELDRLKESKDRWVRWRAGYTLAVLDRLFADGAYWARLRTGDVVPGPDGLTRSAVMIELVFDPPGHVRLPGNDDEIIGRALGIEPLADRKVTLLTYDTGQSMRARNAGLQVVKLTQDLGEEPKVQLPLDQFSHSPTTSRKARDKSSKRGADLETDTTLTSAQATMGSTVTLRVNGEGPCNECQSTGCLATGECPICSGTGIGRTSHLVRARIPAGVTDGQRIKIPGKGPPGDRGGPAGDLYVRVHVVTSDR